MKYFVFVRGEDSAFKAQVVDVIESVLNPDINSVTAIIVSIHDYPTNTTGERKAAGKNIKNSIKRLLAGSHQERFIIINAPNEKPIHWMSMFNLAQTLHVDTLGIGIDVGVNKSDEISSVKNEQCANNTLFIATMYKYIHAINEQDLYLVTKLLNQLLSKEGNI